MIGVNISSADVKILKETMDNEQLPWRSFYDPGPPGQGPIASRWNASATPTYYVIDKQGVIRYKWIGANLEAETIDAALEELIQETDDDGTNAAK